MIEVILGIYYMNSNPALTPLQERLFSACRNTEKYAILTLIFEKFSVGTATRSEYWEGATVPLPRTHPKGAPRLPSA